MLFLHYPIFIHIKMIIFHFYHLTESWLNACSPEWFRRWKQLGIGKDFLHIAVQAYHMIKHLSLWASHGNENWIALKESFDLVNSIFCAREPGNVHDVASNCCSLHSMETQCSFCLHLTRWSKSCVSQHFLLKSSLQNCLIKL